MDRDPNDRIGLCARCRHARVVPARHATYWLCQLSATDPRFPKYPRLPVIECDGYEQGEPDSKPGENPS